MATAVGDATERAPLFAMSPRRVVTAGLFNFSLFLVAVAGGALQQFDFLLPFDWKDAEHWVEIARDSDLLRSIGFTGRALAVIAAIIALMIIGFASGIVRTLLTEHGFRLDRTPAGFRRRRGLLTLTDIVMPIARIQAGMVETGPIRRRFGWYALKLQSLGRESGKEPVHVAAPFAHPGEIAPILREAGLPEPPERAQFATIDPRPALIRFLIMAAMLTAVTVVSLAYGSPAGLWPLLAVLPVGAALALGWWRQGFAVAGSALFLRSGLWRQRVAILPLVRAQSVDLAAGPLHRPFGLAALTVGVAGGSGGGAFQIDALPLAAATSLRDRLIAAAAAIDWADLAAPDLAQQPLAE